MMKAPVTLSDIEIRTELMPRDTANALKLHGELYASEYGYGPSFQKYVAEGLTELIHEYDPKTQRVWVAEHNAKMVGFMALMKRGHQAQLRYFLIRPECRGIGLGNEMMRRFMRFLTSTGYRGAYLWTTNEQVTAAALYKKYGFVITEEKVSNEFGKTLIEQKYELRTSAF